MNSFPQLIIPELEKVLGSTGVVEFGKYKYVPQSLSDKRIVTKVNVANAEGWFLAESQKLQDDEDIALQSNCVDGNGVSYHLPMIDFYEKIDSTSFNIVADLMHSAFGLNTFFLFDSGRAHHLYGFPLLKENEFHSYLGLLLLMNTKNRYIVDTRWVGHRLLAGYAALRWTANNSHYIQIPTLIDSRKM